MYNMDRSKTVLLISYFILIRMAKCQQLTRGSCPQGYVKCEKGVNWRSGTNNNYCIRRDNICDTDSDCTDGSDEKYCASRNIMDEGFHFKFARGPCPAFYVLCLTGSHKFTSDFDKRCIHTSWICKHNACHDGSDSLYCPYNLTKGFHMKFIQSDCPQGYFRCHTGYPKHSPVSANNTNCIKRSWICDGNIDCNDKSDETFCPYVFYQQPSTTTESYEMSSSTSSDDYSNVTDLYTDLTSQISIDQMDSEQSKADSATSQISIDQMDSEQSKADSAMCSDARIIVLDPIAIINLTLIGSAILFYLYRLKATRADNFYMANV